MDTCGFAWHLKLRVGTTQNERKEYLHGLCGCINDFSIHHYTFFLWSNLMGFFVICPACNEEHFVEEVEALNVEEGLIGEDLLTFRCIQTDTIQKSVVYGNNTH